MKHQTSNVGLSDYLAFGATDILEQYYAIVLNGSTVRLQAVQTVYANLLLNDLEDLKSYLFRDLLFLQFLL